MIHCEPARTESGVTLDLIAPRLSPDLLTSFGVRRKPTREPDSTYYLFRAAVLSVEPRRTNLLVKLGTLDGDVVLATMPMFNTSLLGRLCWVVLATHPSEFGRPHRHILRLWPCEDDELLNHDSRDRMAGSLARAG